MPIESADAAYEIEIVDVVGKPVMEATAQVKQDRLTFLVEKIRPGSYWVRVYRKQTAKTLMAEYGLQVT
jgi:hypothetical protein